MFFVVSKVGWFLLAPSTLLVTLVAAGYALSHLKRTTKAGAWLGLGAGAVFLAVCLLPVGDWLMRGLETRFPPLAPCTTAQAKPPAGIILLGGGLSSRIVSGQVVEDLNDAADRMRYAAQLARAYPDLPVIISGGTVFPRPGQRSEADGMADVLSEFGVARSRMQLESRSRTTAENAARVKDLIGDRPGAWLLVTSGYHMPRAMGVFRHAGIDVVAAPTDWRVDERAPLLTFNVSGRLGSLDMAAREYLGLIAYRIAGRTDTLIPGIRTGDVCMAAD
ncbi:MAG: YdcF family protein [Alphaproteobacteria bacterium]|nr:YdcF family protein [Alphaproteobacteria bacterium]